MPLADSALRIKRGHSELEILLRFRCTFESLSSFKLLSNEDAELFSNELLEVRLIGSRMTPGQSWNKWDSNFQPEPIRIVVDFLMNHSLGLLIELNILNNDGNIHDLFFDGLLIMFSNILVPNVNDLSNDLVLSLDLPNSESYALINGIAVLDPLQAEECASDGFIHIFRQNDTIVEIRTEGEISASRITFLIEQILRDKKPKPVINS